MCSVVKYPGFSTQYQKQTTTKKFPDLDHKLHAHPTHKRHPGIHDSEGGISSHAGPKAQIPQLPPHSASPSG